MPNEELWYSPREDFRQAAGIHIESAGDQVVYRLAVHPLPIYRVPPRIGLVIRCYENGDVRMAIRAWRE